MQLSIVVPVYNERFLVGEMLARLVRIEIPQLSSMEIIAVDDSVRGRALEVVSALRRAGVSAIYPYRAGGVGKAFKAAANAGARYAVVIGPDEVAKGVVKAKNLAGGSETEMTVEKLIVPPEINVGQPFGIQVVIQSTVEADVKVMLFENDTLISRTDDRRHLKPGRNYFEFPNIRRDRPGQYSYEIQVEPLDNELDAVVQNNIGFGCIARTTR